MVCLGAAGTGGRGVFFDGAAIFLTGAAGFLGVAATFLIGAATFFVGTAAGIAGFLWLGFAAGVFFACFAGAGFADAFVLAAGRALPLDGLFFVFKRLAFNPTERADEHPPP